MTSNDAARLEPALKAFLAGDAASLKTVLDADPEVVNLRLGDNTLLELATQPQAGVIPREVIAALIDAGADLDRALNLAGCWNLAELARQLLDAGADPTARADANITPLESAAMHGSRESADVLVTRGVHRDGLWLAAAAGELDLVRNWVSADGRLLRPPGGYRPNFADVGRPAGAPPTDDGAEIMGEAFVFAAANGRIEVVEYLHAAGVDVDSRPYRNTTGLHLAVQFSKLEMVRRLLDLGASITIEDDQYRSDARGWARACDRGSPLSAAILAVVDVAGGR